MDKVLKDYEGFLPNFINLIQTLFQYIKDLFSFLTAKLNKEDADMPSQVPSGVNYEEPDA